MKNNPFHNNLVIELGFHLSNKKAFEKTGGFYQSKNSKLTVEMQKQAMIEKELVKDVSFCQSCRPQLLTL